MNQFRFQADYNGQMKHLHHLNFEFRKTFMSSYWQSSVRSKTLEKRYSLKDKWWANNFIFIQKGTRRNIYNHWFKFSLLFSSAIIAQTLFGLGNRFCLGIFSPNCRLNSGFCASSLNMRANLSCDALTNETNTLWFPKMDMERLYRTAKNCG